MNVEGLRVRVYVPEFGEIVHRMDRVFESAYELVVGI